MLSAPLCCYKYIGKHQQFLLYFSFSQFSICLIFIRFSVFGYNFSFRFSYYYFCGSRFFGSSSLILHFFLAALSFPCPVLFISISSSFHSFRVFCLGIFFSSFACPGGRPSHLNIEYEMVVRLQVGGKQRLKHFQSWYNVPLSPFAHSVIQTCFLLMLLMLDAEDSRKKQQQQKKKEKKKIDTYYAEEELLLLLLPGLAYIRKP